MEPQNDKFAKEPEAVAPALIAAEKGDCSPLMDWVANAATVFVNGFISGLGSGVGVGAAAIAQADTMDPQVLSIRGAAGALIAAACHGVKRVVVWHDSNPVPRIFP